METMDKFTGKVQMDSLDSQSINNSRCNLGKHTLPWHADICSTLVFASEKIKTKLCRMWNMKDAVNRTYICRSTSIRTRRIFLQQHSPHSVTLQTRKLCLWFVALFDARAHTHELVWKPKYFDNCFTIRGNFYLLSECAVVGQVWNWKDRDGFYYFWTECCLFLQVM